MELFCLPLYSLFSSAFLIGLFTIQSSCNLTKPEFPPIYVSLSSLYKEPTHSTVLIDREIQIHWVDGTADKISIYNEEPNPSIEPILQFNTAQYPDYLLETNISFGNPAFPGGWERSHEVIPLPGDHCLPPWVVGYYKGNITYTDCFKIRPTWMQDNRLYLENMRITSLFLPGTHNSGSYKRGETLSYRDTSGRYILTQDQSIWNQMVYGIRYLDLRVAYYPINRNASESAPSDNCFWINHDLIKVRQLTPLLQDIKSFLKKTKDEILVLDLHRFPAGFNGRQSRHIQLVKLLERELKEYAMPYKRNFIPTLGNIWDQGKRIIISYGDNTIAQEYDWLWPPIRQLWGNKQKVEDLYEYLEACMRNDSLREEGRGLWAAMAELTPGPMDLLLKPKGSLREMAHRVNKDLTTWCRELWWDRANVIATDFFLGTDVIGTAITANIIKGSSAAKQYSIS